MAALAVAVPILPATTAEAKVVDPLATVQVCDGPVCVTKMHESDLARLAGPGKEALRLLGTLPGAPTKVVELDRRPRFDEVPPRATGTVVADLMDWPLRLSDEPDDMKRTLLAGAGTPSCYSSMGRGRFFLDEVTARAIAQAGSSVSGNR